MGAGIDEIRSDIWRHRFALRDVGLGALVIATGILVATVLTDGPDGSATLVASGSNESVPTPSADPSDSFLEPTATPASSSASASASAEVTGAPGSSPSATAPAPEPTAAASAVGAPRPSRTPVPSAAAAGYPAKGLRLEVSAKADGGLAGVTTVRVRDNDGSWNGGYIAFGDGQRHEFGRNRPSCDKQSAPGEARPTDVTKTFRHTYGSSGSYNVVVSVRTERFCSGAPVEEASRTVRVTIPRQGATTPSPGPTSGSEPTPSPEPTPEPSPEPTPEPTFGPRPR